MTYLRLITSFLLIIISHHSFAEKKPTNNKNPSSLGLSNDACQIEKEPNNDSITKFRNGTLSFVCKAVRGIDSWFGSEQIFDDNDFGGKLTIGFRQDEDTGFDPRIRLRLNATLPNVSSRFNAFIGRTDNDAFIQDRKVTGVDEINNDLANEDVRWLIGLGYRNPKNTGFDTSLGASFSSSIQPFAKLRYRYFKQLGNFSARFKQTLFWENEDGFGTTSNLSFHKPLNETYLSTIDIESTFLIDTEILESAASITLFRKLSNQSGLAFRTFILNESGSNSAVTTPEFGVSINYRQPVLKPWLILRASLENRWERENNNEPIESFAKLGIQFEMIFGKYKRKR